MDTIEKISYQLSQKGITATKMMKELGFSTGLFSQWKKGLQNPSAEKIKAIADYLNVSVDYLIGASLVEKTYTQPEYIEAQKNPLPEKAVPEQWNEIFKSMDIDELLKLLNDLSHELSERQLGQAKQAVQKSPE